VRKIIYSMAIVAATASCGQSPPLPLDHFYRLIPPATSMEKQRLTDDIIYVEGFFAEGLFNDRALLYVSDEHSRELQQHHYHYWVASPPHLLRDYLAQFLRNAEAAPMVVNDVGADRGLAISGKVIEFERHDTPAGRIANVALELRVGKTDSETPFLFRQYQVSENIQGDDMNAAVAGFNAAVDRIYVEFLMDLKTALALEEAE
jgi:ABC-type uncharacterized transport system, auxiliary component